MSGFYILRAVYLLQDVPLPHELRPPAVLKLSMDFLLCNIVDRIENMTGSMAEWYAQVSNLSNLKTLKNLPVPWRGRQSTEVAFTLLTQLPQVRYSARHYSVSGQCQLSKNKPI